MKRELALRLLESILPGWEEGQLKALFDNLNTLAEYKYNHYEMYQPGRLFFENLYLWLKSFSEADRNVALRFVQQQLIYISREEFQQLTQILYYDRIHQSQLDLVAEITGIPRFHIRKLMESPVLGKIERASLYVALSDGARIDYFRRQNLRINNEQVLTTYQPNIEKVQGLIGDLEKELKQEGARFRCLFLIDDFCASGKTVLREEMQADGKSKILKGVFAKIQNEGNLLKALENTDARIYFCPLVLTELAQRRLNDLIPKLPSPLNRTILLPAVVLPDSVRIKPPSYSSTENEGIASLCMTYYQHEFGDSHTQNVMFGYEECGLPVVLHHNTPNNSIYLLWSRKLKAPLFVRYERHGREGS